MGKAIIRDYRPEDREAIRRICYDTGFMGGPVTEQYRDYESFVDMLTSYYTDAEPQHAVVAELDGKVVGYILACLDTRKMWSTNWIAFKHAALRGVCFRPGTARFWFRGWYDTFADIGKPGRTKIDYDRFPSHVHVNLLPEGRGASLGTEFFFRVFDKLKAAGSTGLHGESMIENTKMIDFGTKRLNYEPLGEPYALPAMRMPDGRRAMVRIYGRSLEDWEPGAWKAKAKAQHVG